MRHRYCTLLFLSLSFLIFQACSTNTGSQNKSQGEFAELGKDQAFKDAHEEPKAANDKPLRGKVVQFPTEGSKEKGSAYMVMAKEPADQFLLMIHEWWGLNEHIKHEADRYQEALGNINVIALDLYDGNVAENRDDAAKYMEACKPERAEAIIQGAMKIAGEQAKFATIGWCFGGGWSLKSSILLGDRSEACVIYYGMPEMDAKKLAPLQAEVLGLFAENDKWITPKVATDFENVMKALGKQASIHQFKADHAFANPSSERYDNEEAKRADAMTMDFLRKKLSVN